MKNIVLGIIPARGRSKGVPGKNIKKLAARPLIYYTIKEAKAARTLDKVIVSTDDKRIAGVAAGLGLKVPFLRPRSLAKDTTPMAPVVQHAVRAFEKQQKCRVGIIVLLQPTSPLRKADDIDKGVKKIIKTKADSVISVCELEYLSNPLLIKRMKGGRLVPYKRTRWRFTSRQAVPKLYRLNGALYIVRRDVIMKKGTFFGSDTRALTMDESRSIDIDTELDFKIAEALLRISKRRKR